MKVIRTNPHNKYTCDQVAEVFHPDFCDRAHWTPENNYIPHNDEHSYVLNDAAPCGLGWRVRNGVPIAPEVEVLEDIKVDKLAEIAESRWNTEVGGITYAGLKVYTDRESQAKYTGAIVTYQAVQALPSAWKCENGWLPINAIEDLMNLAMAVQQHVQTCYAHEAELQAQVQAAETAEDVQEVTWGVL
jgi:hypothetical protein